LSSLAGRGVGQHCLGRASARRRRIGGYGGAQTAKILKTREKSGSGKQANLFSANTRHGGLSSNKYYVAVDRQLTSGFGTYEAAEKAAKEIKKRYPNPQVTVFDSKKVSHSVIEQPMASTKRAIE
jgi:hypothetical protein